MARRGAGTGGRLEVNSGRSTEPGRGSGWRGPATRQQLGGWGCLDEGVGGARPDVDDEAPGEEGREVGGEARLDEEREEDEGAGGERRDSGDEGRGGGHAADDEEIGEEAAGGGADDGGDEGEGAESDGDAAAAVGVVSPVCDDVRGDQAQEHEFGDHFAAAGEEDEREGRAGEPQAQRVKGGVGLCSLPAAIGGLLSIVRD